MVGVDNHHTTVQIQITITPTINFLVMILDHASIALELGALINVIQDATEKY